MKIFNQPTGKYPKRTAGFTSKSITGTPDFVRSSMPLFSWLYMMFYYKVYMRVTFSMAMWSFVATKIYWNNPPAWNLAKRAEYWALTLFTFTPFF